MQWLNKLRKLYPKGGKKHKGILIFFYWEFFLLYPRLNLHSVNFEKLVLIEYTL